MLSESTIRKECNKLGLSTDGNKPQLIRWAVCLRIGVGLQRAPITFVLKYRVLGARIRDQERKMITMGNVTGHVSHDVTPIHKVLSAELIIKLSKTIPRLMRKICLPIWREWKERSYNVLLLAMALILMTRLTLRYSAI